MKRDFQAFKNRTAVTKEGSSFTAKRGITTALTEMGYEETLLVDGKTIKSTLWFYGELDPCNLGNNTH